MTTNQLAEILVKCGVVHDGVALHPESDPELVGCISEAAALIEAEQAKETHEAAFAVANRCDKWMECALLLKQACAGSSIKLRKIALAEFERLKGQP